MINDTPLISVILPVNADHGFLNDSIKSIQNQTFKEFEFIIVANNCSDDLWHYLENIAIEDKRIKPVRLKMGGLVFALNYGLELAQGSYIARMDADDVAKNNRLEIQINYLEQNSDVVVLGTQIEFIDENGNLKHKQGKARPLSDHDIKENLYRNSPLAHPSVMFRKNEIIKIGGYKFGFYGEDYDLWLRCKEQNYKLENLDQILVQYRIHGNQETDLSSFRKISDPVSALIFLYLKKTNNLKFLKGLFYQSRFYFKSVNFVKSILGK